MDKTIIGVKITSLEQLEMSCSGKLVMDYWFN